jgi:hypothetical protein
VLLLIPLALAEQLEASTVDHQVQRAMRNGLGPASGKAATAAGQCRVVRNAQLLPEQPKYAGYETLSLAQGKLEDEP